MQLFNEIKAILELLRLKPEAICLLERLMAGTMRHQASKGWHALDNIAVQQYALACQHSSTCHLSCKHPTASSNTNLQHQLETRQGRLLETHAAKPIPPPKQAQ